MKGTFYVVRKQKKYAYYRTKKGEASEQKRKIQP